MRSLAKTLRRCHSTVRGLRKSCAPISGLDSPSRASPAMCRSCGVSSSRASTLRARTRLAGGDQLVAGAFGERLHADGREQVVRRSQLCARVDAARAAAQPFPVEEVRACEVGA